MMNKKNALSVDKLTEISPEDLAKLEAKEGEAKEGSKDLTPEEKEEMKKEISDAYARRITFMMYKRQIIQCCEYALSNRKSIQDMKDEVSAKVSPLPANARKFISEIKPEAFVQLAAMINVDFSEDHSNDAAVVVTNKKEVETKEESDASNKEE